MSALILRPIDESVSIEPTYEAILTRVAHQYGLTPAAIRAAADDAAAGARDLFIWLCDQLKSEPRLAATSYVAMPQHDALAAMASVDRQRQADPDLRVMLDELALILQVEASTVERMGLRKVDEPDPLTIARRVIVSPRAASRASIREIEIMASAIVALSADRMMLEQAQTRVAQLEAALAEAKREAAAQKTRISAMLDSAAAEASDRAQLRADVLRGALRQFMRDQHDLERDQGSPLERVTRQRAEKSLAALMARLEPMFNHTRSFK